MKKKIVTILISVLSATLAFSQTGAEMPNIIPPSPNAQTFLKYGEFPVSNYTGVPDITIPIYTIKLKDLSIPIGISYNASGIRVDEEASRVGLGWILNAGGLITHTIMGRFNDFDRDAYFNKQYPMFDMTGWLPYPAGLKKYTVGSWWTEFPYNLISIENKYIFYRTLGNDNFSCQTALDLAPDVFNYNFMGYTGKFIFNRDGKIIQERQDDNFTIELLSIEPNVSYDDARSKKTLKSWRITTPDGTKYNFSQTEECIPQQLASEKYNSTFYLTSIETVTGTVVNFVYKKSPVGIFNKIIGFTQGTGTLSQINNFSWATFEVVYLDEITYPNGSIKFNYLSDREDCSTEMRLKSISIYENNGNTSQWNFTQNYFVANTTTNEIMTLNDLKNRLPGGGGTYYTDNWKNKRLKLSELTHSSNSSNEKEKYQFVYNEDKLPNKLSTSQDHWGYYNGRNNYGLIPAFSQNISQKTGTIEVQGVGIGANREPSEQYNQAFILKRIIYPTGGKTEFTYESNKYKTNDFENDPHKRDFMYSPQKIEVFAPYGSHNAGADWNISSNIFSIGYKPYGKINAYLFLKIWVNKDRYNNMSLYLNGAARTMHLSVNNGNVEKWSQDYNIFEIPTKLTENYLVDKSWNTDLPHQGNYRLRAAGNMITCVDSLRFWVVYHVDPDEYMAAHPFDTGGGLRIKEIKSFDTDGSYSFGKQYRYTTDGSTSENKTSGRLMFYPRYRNSYISVSSNGLRGGGFSVGYSKVNVFDMDKNGNTLGKTEFEYINKPDKNLFYTWDDTREYQHNGETHIVGAKVKDENPDGIGAYKFAENGTLLKETIYKEGNKLKETINTYNISGDDGPHIIWGVQKNYNNSFLTAFDVFIPGLLDYYHNHYSALGNFQYCTSDMDEDLALINAAYTFFKTNNSSNLESQMAFGYFYPALRPLFILLNQKKVTDYENGQEIETITNYSYNSKNQLSKEEITSQNQVIKKIEYNYPNDKTSESCMQQLINANRINQPVEVKQTINNSIRILKNSYSLFNNIPRVANVMSNTVASNTFETRITYNNYDSYGNPSYIIKDGADKVVYIWGYKGQYPIAEIKNTTYSDVCKAIGNGNETTGASILNSITSKNKPEDDSNFGLINNLRTSLPNAMVTTYAYKPLVGILTVTDPRGTTITYAYDSFGRLQNVKDANGKNVENYEYHYKN